MSGAGWQSAASLVFTAAGGALLAGALWWVVRDPPAHAPERIAPLMAAADSDGDGEISAEEYAALGAGSSPMSLYDLDGDGAIGPREFEIGLRYIDPMWLYLDPD